MRIFSHFRFARTVAAAAALALAAPALAQAPVSPAPEIAMPDGRSTGDASSAQAVELVARPAAMISGSADWEEGFATLMKSFDALRGAMDKAGLKAGGKPIAVFIDTDDQGFKYQAMIPLDAAPVAGQSLAAPVSLGKTPAGKTMKFEHRSAYDDIDSTYEAITAYLDEKGIEAKPLFVEEYATEPKTADDTALQVDIFVFLK